MFLLDAISARPAQPQGAFSVAPDFASGLLALFNAPNPSDDWTRVGTATQQPVAGGVAFESAATNTRFEKTVVGNQNTGFTMHLRFIVRVTTVQDYAGIYNGATYQALFYVGGTGRLFFGPKNGTLVQAHTKVFAAGDVVSICAKADGARYYISTTINGITERVTASYTGTSAYTAVHVGAKFTATGSHRTMTGAFWTRALPDELVDLLAREPLRLFDDETNGAPITFEAASGNSGDYEATDSPDVFEADGDLVIEGDYAATDQPDTFAADGDLVIQGDYAATDEPDVFAAASSETIEGDYAATDSPDVFAADGDLLIEGDYAATDSPDVFAATDIVPTRSTFPVPGFELPSNTAVLAQDGQTNRQWLQWFDRVHSIASAQQQAGPTAARPVTRLWIGRQYFDTDLGRVVYVKEVNPAVWVDATGATV